MKKEIGRTMAAILFVVSGAGFFVSLYFTSYTLQLFGTNPFMSKVFIAFAAVIQSATVLFAILTGIKNRWYLPLAFGLALLNIFATTAFGTYTFQRVYRTGTRVDATYQNLQDRKDYLIELIESARRDRDAMPDDFLTWKQRKNTEILSYLEQVEDLDSQISAYVFDEATDTEAPVTLFVTVGAWIGLQPLTVAMIYYVLSAVFLEVTITMFAGVGAAAIQRKRKAPTAPAPAPAVRVRPPAPSREPRPVPRERTAREVLLRFIEIAWPMAAKNGFTPGREYIMKATGWTEKRFRWCVRTCAKMGLTEIRGTKSRPLVDQETAVREAMKI